ncbi:hypothetical protein F5B22DRAFT_528214 [Xylaria bambusicola]|uniref:uncharacterized protein n=1 Tax=Xylaria bambusicola TaxID=326684 RepID=UPI0020080632|nr:uncharacterized protein F5B22DRAFT_528214 [Xylaria bambusicola]KAI0505314.1 hypothetical protein F5B22DRAFT_528214 [Xylaria bambusicola]
MDTGQDASGSQGSHYPIYVGIWTNWSRGQVMGSTLTISRRDANLLIAFTAFFVAFVTTRVWRIICFMFHRFHSTADPQDAVHHQHQTILRNSSSPESGIQMLLCLLWANRSSERWLRPLPPTIVAIVCLSMFTIAGGFSSQISTAVGNEVLIKSSNCGFTSVPVSGDDVSYVPEESNIATAIDNAANYAQQCYSNENTGLLDCNRFPTQEVPKVIDTQASCPFKPHLCRTDSTNLRLDSGYLDSHKIFGLNAPPHNRISFRNVLHCAPLTTTGFGDARNSSIGPYTFYRYGTNANSDFDYVHAAPSLESQYARVASKDIILGYTNQALSVYSSIVKNETTYAAASDFRPIDDIFRKDGDIYLAFLSGNGVIFTEPSDDLWYHLTIAPDSINIDDVNSGTSLFYIPGEPASPLGCTDQYQFCSNAFEGTSGCGPLASLRDAIQGAAPFFNMTYVDFATNSFKNEMGARFLYFMNSFFASSTANIYYVLQQLGAAGLTSQKTLLAGFQGPIAPNQWQRDVTHWWDISMATMQSEFFEMAYLPDDSDLHEARFNYTASAFQKSCTNQKIRTSAYASFSLFGLFFTLTVGLLLALVSYLLEPISGWLRRRNGYNQYPHLEWTTTSTLQLQRLLHEEVGFGTWSAGTETIPVTKPGEVLGSLDITNPKHPVLRRPTDTAGAPSSTRESAETEHSITSNESEHTYVSLTLSNYHIDAQEIVNANSQNESGRDETQAQEQEPNTNPSTAPPGDSTPLEQIVQSVDSRNTTIP